MTTTAETTAATRSLDRVIGALDAAGARYTARGRHVQASCPAHEDRAPSLSIDYRPDAAKPGTLVHCQAGCDAEDVLAALSLTLSDLYDEPPAKPAAGSRPQRPARQRREPQAPKAPAGPACSGKYPDHAYARVASPAQENGCVWHPYLDEAGNEVAWKVRRPCRRPGCTDRTFAWRYLTRDGEITWRRDARPARMPLYRQADAVAAAQAGHPVYITEGESDADAIAAAGAAACTHGNADHGTKRDGTSWKAHHTDALAAAGAREVIVCADRDASGLGRRSAEYIAEQITAAGIVAHVVEPAAGKDVRDHLAAGHNLADLRRVTGGVTGGVTGQVTGADEPLTCEVTGVTGPEDKGPRTRARGNVVPLHGGEWKPEDEWEPQHGIPMSMGAWGYSTHAEQRGVWYRPTGRGAWSRVAPLPYVRARILRRSPNGTPAGMDYLLSASEDGPGVVTSTLKLKDGTWANELGVALSYDDKIVKAAGTAILTLAEQSADIREAVPRASDNGEISVPVPESLPDGYLRISPADPDDARRALAEIIRSAAESPTLALVMGGSAVAPYIKPLNRQSHVLHLHSPEGGTGKSTCARIGAGLWGDPFTRGSGVLRSWNATQTGIGRHLGQLGILPVFLDESGMARWEPGEWGQVLFELTEGNDRLLAEAKGSGTRIGSPWGGMLLSTGNARLTAAVSATRFGGVFRRVIELGTPFTRDAEHAEELAELMRTAWGHPGAAILRHYATSTVAERISAAENVIGLPTDGAARTIARHVAGHVAGAGILDDLAGTGSTLADAALAAAREIVDQWLPPASLADRLIAAVRDSVASHPAAWPTISDYRATKQARDAADMAALPVHGIEREIVGVRADDDSWLALFARAWSDLCARNELDEGDTLAELHARGVLAVSATQLARREWQSFVRLDPKPATAARMYKLRLPELDDDQGDDDTGQAPTPTPGGITPEGATDSAEIGGAPDQPALPTGCRRCGEPIDPVAERATGGWHLLCAPGPEDCPGCGRHVGDVGRERYAGWHPVCAPADVRAAGDAATDALRAAEGSSTAPVAHRASQRAAEPQRGAEGRQETGSGHLERLDEQVRDFRRTLQKRHELDVTEDQARAGLAAWHRATDGLRFLGWDGDVATALYARVVARDGLVARGVDVLTAQSSPAVEEASAGLALHLDWLTDGSDLDEDDVVSEFDVNGQYLAAAGIPLGVDEPDQLERAPRAGLRMFRDHPGYVRLAGPVSFPDGVLPHTRAAWAGVEPGRWLALTPAEWLERQGAAVPVDRVLWWPERKRHRPLVSWQKSLRVARERLMGDPDPAARLAVTVLKSTANTFLGGMLRSERKAPRHCRIDWSDMVITQAWMRALIAVEKAGQDGAQVLGMRRDSAWFRTPGTATPGPVAPAGLVVSDQLGKWKPGRWAEATPQMVEEYRAGSPEKFNSALKAAHETREVGQ